MTFGIPQNVGNYTRFQILRLFVPDPKTHDMLAKFLLLLVPKSLPDAFLIPGIITSPIFVDTFTVGFTVLPSVISDVLLVLLTVSSLAAGDSFLVNVIPSFTPGFENLNVLSMLSLLLGQDSLSFLYVILLVVGLFRDNPLVIL